MRILIALSICGSGLALDLGEKPLSPSSWGFWFCNGRRATVVKNVPSILLATRKRWYWFGIGSLNHLRAKSSGPGYPFSVLWVVVLTICWPMSFCLAIPSWHLYRQADWGRASDYLLFRRNRWSEPAFRPRLSSLYASSRIASWQFLVPRSMSSHWRKIFLLKKCTF